MAYDAGDAVLKFVGDTSQLDLAFDEIKTKGAEAWAPAKGAADGLVESLNGLPGPAKEAGDAMEEAGERGAHAMREARGEAGLLGEAMGIRLPRHVRSFIAELPGVGEALSAAFSATAVLFIIQAVIELTNKVTEFISTHFIFTEEMKKATEAVIKQNEALTKYKEAGDAAQKTLDAFGKTAVDVANEKVKALEDELAKQEEAERKARDSRYAYEHDNLNNITKAQYEAYGDQVVLAHNAQEAIKKEIAAGQLGVVTAIGEADQKIIEMHKTRNLAELALQESLAKAMVAGTQGAEEKEFAIEETYKEKRYQLERSSIQQSASLELQMGRAEKYKELINKLDVLDRQRTTEYTNELNKQKDSLEKTLEKMQADLDKNLQAQRASNLPTPAEEESKSPGAKLVKDILAARDAAKSLGVTIRADLVAALDSATEAEIKMAKAGIFSAADMNQAHARVAELQKQLDELGKTEDKLKLKTETTWKGFIQDLHQGANAMHEMKDIGQTAFNDMSKNIESAFQSIVLGQGNVAQALEKATASSLAAIAAQAAVKALFYTAEGFAAMAGFEEQSASQYFTAAGEMAAVAVLAGAAGFGLSRAAGAGGGGGSTEQLHNSQSNTGSQASGRTTQVGVQYMAEGGLVSGPTLAVIGERMNTKEAVVPLNDPKALKEIGGAISDHGGGGGINVFTKGIVSDDTMIRVMKRMSGLVKTGKATLTSSNSMRLTRRSA